MNLSDIEGRILTLQEEIRQLWVAFHQCQRQEAETESDRVSLVGILGDAPFQGSDTIKKDFARFMADAEIPERTLGVEQLQERMAELGLDPDEFSRAIIDMRDTQ